MAMLAAQNRLSQNASQNATVRQTPTPANTGAPMPGYRKRTTITPISTGAPMPKITPQSTGAPMPKANTQQAQKTSVKHTRAYPKMQKNPTAPGTKPKKK